MTKHYSEADLLETYYTQPGESMPVMMHLASCSDCAAKYEKLDRKLREAAACHTEKPETFWSRQRLSIMRRLNGQPRAAVVHWRYVAAAALAFLLGGAVVYETLKPSVKPAPAATRTVVTEVAPPPADDIDVDTPRDPWESDELEDFHSVVQWESWVAQSRTKSGDTSL